MAKYLKLEGGTKVTISQQRREAESGCDPRIDKEDGNMSPKHCETDSDCVALGCQKYDFLKKGDPAERLRVLGSCARDNAEQFLTEHGIARDRLVVALVNGGNRLARLDQICIDELPVGPGACQYVDGYDGIIGPRGIYKAMRMADCGMLVVTGTDAAGTEYSGMLHATRDNLKLTEYNGNLGSFARMLAEVVEGVGLSPDRDMRLELVSTIDPQYYMYNFTPRESDLEKNPHITAEHRREQIFTGWYEKGWLMPRFENGEWDGATYSANPREALRYHIGALGMNSIYSEENLILFGDPTTGHASHTAASNGLVPNGRDLYIVN